MISPLRTILPLLGVLLLAVNPALAQGVLVDKSDIRFVAKQMGVNVEGRFRKWTANVVFLPAALDKSRAEFDIDLASVDLASTESETELKGPAWFDSTKFPKAHFASASIKDQGGGKYEIAGSLSLKGVTKAYVVPVTRQNRWRGQPRGRGQVQSEAPRLPGRRGDVGRHRHRCQRRHRLGAHRAAAGMNDPRNIPTAARVCSRGGAFALSLLRVGPNQQQKQRGHTVNFRALIGGLAAAIAIPAAAQESYVIDPAHSQPFYETRHLGFSLQRGTFGKVAGKVTLDRAAQKGTIDVTIETASVRSQDPRSDAALKGEKYFNVEKYPTMTFKSNSLRFDGDRVVGAEGELTMLGVTKPVSLKVSDFTCGDHPFSKKPMCGAEVTTTIKRSEWGMTAGLPFAPADDVKIMIPVEALRE